VVGTRVSVCALASSFLPESFFELLDFLATGLIFFPIVLSSSLNALLGYGFLLASRLPFQKNYCLTHKCFVSNGAPSSKSPIPGGESVA
jgi:hypothetical protein